MVTVCINVYISWIKCCEICNVENVLLQTYTIILQRKWKYSKDTSEEWDRPCCCSWQMYDDVLLSHRLAEYTNSLRSLSYMMTTKRAHWSDSLCKRSLPSAASSDRHLLLQKQLKWESRAVAKKPRDAAAVLFGLKFTISLRVPKLRKPGFRAPNNANIPAQNRI